MKITDLFVAQNELDENVGERVREGYDTNSHYCFDHRVFAFHCELMEFANELGFFKFWKKSHIINRPRALDEGIDCIHFLLSIGNMKGYSKSTKEIEPFGLWEHYSVEDMFYLLRTNNLDNIAQWGRAFELVLGILMKLDYTEQEITDQYYRKNSINLQRQRNGY